MSVNGKPSRRLLFFLLALGAALAASAIARQQESAPKKQGAVDWILVLDTSASMRGAGGSRNIFDDVKASLEDFVRNARAGDSVTIYTFDRDTVTRPTVRISDETDKRDVFNIIRGIQATGDKTHTGKAIRDALLRAAELKQRSEAANRVPAIVLLTDGREDVSGIQNPVSIPSNVELLSNTQPYIFFVSLGQEHDQQIENLIRALGPRSGVVRDRGAEQIAELANRIRPIVEPAAEATPTPTPTPITITVEPVGLDFGRVEPGGQTGRVSFEATSNADVVVRLVPEGGQGDLRLVEPSGPISLKAGARTSVGVQLAVEPGVADGPRTLNLKLGVSETDGSPPAAAVKAAWAEARVTVEHVSVLSKLWKWLVLLLIILILAAVAFIFIKGDTPWALWGDWRRGRFLEGELMVLDPPPAREEDERIDLAGLEAKSVVLSALVPALAGGADDGELTAPMRDGRKQVQLRRTRGEVRVEGVPVYDTYLYNEDIIELGGVRLRFDRVGFERPIEPEGEPLD